MLCQYIVYQILSFIHMTSTVLGDEHLVYSGACAPYDTEFCSRQVENSVCNKEKNECFCKKDFVAIRENGRVTCKTLLTDLKCRVDRDCIHVNRSSCHPGAGYCSCPGNTIYVPQQHACRTRVGFVKDPVCEACQMQNGSCFLYEQFELSNLGQRVNPGRIGCVCPENKAAITVHSDKWIHNICAGKLVDIGSECDQKIAICRSKQAVCEPISPDQPPRSINPHTVPANFLWPNIVDYSVMQDRSNNEPVKVCQCQETMIPVYQTTLGYTECFTKLAPTAIHCKACVESGGVCYDLNDDGVGDGCACPPHKSSNSKPRSIGEHRCTTLHVSVNCSDGYFTVCYRPHSTAPYEQLLVDLLENKAVAQLIPASNGNSLVFHAEPPSKSKTVLTRIDTRLKTTRAGDDCQLMQVKNSNSESVETLKKVFKKNQHVDMNEQTEFCFHRDVWRKQSTCGIRLYNLGTNSIQYEGILEILVNQSMRTPNKDLQIPLKCIAAKPNRVPIEESLLDKPIAKPVDLEFRIVNNENKEIYSIKNDQLIRLDALLLDSSNKFKVISVESCYYSNRSMNSAHFAPHKSSLFIDKGCPVNSSSVSVQFTSGYYPSDHLQSTLFPAFREGNLSSLFFRCLFRMCLEPQYCRQEPCDTTQFRENATFSFAIPTFISKNRSLTLFKETTPRLDVNGSRPTRSKFVERWTHIEVNLDISNVAPVRKELKAQSSTYEFTMDSKLRHFNLPSLSSPTAASKYEPCHFALCLNTTHLTWLSIGILSFFVLLSLLLLFLYKKRHTPTNNSNKSYSRHNQQSTASYNRCPAVLANRTCISNIPLGDSTNSHAQSLVRLPACLLGSSGIQEQLQQRNRESGILSPVYFTSNSGCFEENDPQLLCFRDPAINNTVYEVKGLIDNVNASCERHDLSNEAYCYCDYGKISGFDKGTNRNRTVSIQKQLNRLENFATSTHEHDESVGQSTSNECCITRYNSILRSKSPSTLNESNDNCEETLYNFSSRIQNGGNLRQELTNNDADKPESHLGDLIVLNNCAASVVKIDHEVKLSNLNDCVTDGFKHVLT